jgi:hypothetical protein
MERPPRSGGRLAALALAQIVAWGVLYYARNRFITAGIFVAGIAAGAIRGALTLVQASAVAIGGERASTASSTAPSLHRSRRSLRWHPEWRRLWQKPSGRTRGWRW